MNPQVSTKIIEPHPLLQPYLRFFAVRNFNTGNIFFPKAIITEYEIQINFYLTSMVYGFEKAADDVRYTYSEANTIQCYYTGIQSSTKGFVLLKGETTILTLHFRPVGFYNIFKILPKYFTNSIGCLEEILGEEIKLLYEEMREAKDIHKSIATVEHYLIHKMRRSVKLYQHDGIRHVADLLIASSGNYSISKLAYDCNMSVQTMEVRFSEMVGTDPKSFASIVRFGSAVLKKLYSPFLTWTKIAYDCGYYDQMHLIKAFKKFSGLTPNVFMRFNHPPVEDLIYEDEL